ncbi:MAG: DinB family protein [Fimbriimonadaceae bacterium]
MKNYYLIPALSSNPTILRRTLELITPEKITIPTHADRFSPHDVICHLNDWEPIMREERMKLAFANPGAAFLAYDEGEMAIERNYAARDLQQQLAEFVSERAKTIEFVQSLSEEDWKKTAYHPERGEVTLSDLVNMVACHDIYHVDQLWAVIP